MFSFPELGLQYARKMFNQTKIQIKSGSAKNTDHLSVQSRNIPPAWILKPRPLQTFNLLLPKKNA